MQKRILKIGLPQAVEVFGMWGIQMFCLSIISELPIKGVLGARNNYPDPPGGKIIPQGVQ